MEKERKGKETMKITFIPDYRKSNSYQTNLSNSLSDLGISVNFDNGYLAIPKSVMNHGFPDVLHIHWHHPFLMANNEILSIIKSVGFICQLSLLRFMGVKIVWTVHNITGHKGKFEHIELLFNKYLAKVCDRLIVHCPYAKDEVIRKYCKNESSVIVIPHGNYIDQNENTIKCLDARNRLNLNEEDIVFLYFGQIRAYKGILELINVFKRLGNANSTKLLIIGKSYDNEISKNIVHSCNGDSKIRSVLEFIPDDDIQIYMNAADIVILPYKNILTSGAVIMAMSFGRPVIVPDTGCMSDTIIDNKGGFLYSTNTENGLFEVIKRVLNTDNVTLRDMGKYNLRLAEQFPWKEIGKRTYSVYDCLVKR